MEVVALEELGPELLLAHLDGDVLEVLPPHRRVRLEDALDDVGGEVVLEPVGAVRLRLDVRHEGAGNADGLLGRLAGGGGGGVSGGGGAGGGGGGDAVDAVAAGYGLGAGGAGARGVLRPELFRRYDLKGKS